MILPYQLQKIAEPSVEEAAEFILSLFSKLFDDDSSLSATDDMITSKRLHSSTRYCHHFEYYKFQDKKMKNEIPIFIDFEVVLSIHF